MSENRPAPIIIKRKKVVGGDGHHGGAWKVAYADFVTAMMAFFMLMWLLNATTETQRKGLADYFSPTIAVARVSGGGDGAFGGDSLFSEKDMSQSGRGGLVHQDPKAMLDSGAREEKAGQPDPDEDAMKKLQEGLVGKGGESLLKEMMFEHIVTRVTDEGLIVEIFELENRPLFERNMDEPTKLLKEIIEVVSETFGLVENQLEVGTHTHAFPEVLRRNPAWSLTTSRAQRVRELLEDYRFPGTRVQSVAGYGERDPTLDDPMDVRNTRVVLTLLRKDK